MNFKFKNEIKFNLGRLNKLISSRILWEFNNPVHRQSVLIEVLVLLKDLLIKADQIGKRVNFIDDVLVDDKLKIKDVTGLISNFRDAACHSDSFRRLYGDGGIILSFNEARGVTNLISIGDYVIGCKYDDDLIFNMGKHCLYLKRHIERAYNELCDIFYPIINSN